MSMPTGPSNKLRSRNLGRYEFLHNIVANAPQESRPILLDGVEERHLDHVIQDNGAILYWNGVIWYPDDTIGTPDVLADGTIVYADNVRRMVSGTFVWPSGLTIDKHLNMINNNGIKTDAFGVVTNINGKEIKQGPPKVGIIAKPGSVSRTGLLEGLQALSALDQVDFATATTIVAQGPALAKGPVTGTSSTIASRTQTPLPPSTRPPGALKLTQIEIRDALPVHMRHLLRNHQLHCSADCKEDESGLPQCMGTAEARQHIGPYIEAALAEKSRR